MTNKERQDTQELINQYVARLKENYNNQLNCALVYFLTKDLTSGNNFSSEKNDLITKRKLFILKVLKECTFAGRFQIATFPSEVEKKLIEAYNHEKQKEEDEKQAHIAELMEEMNEIF